jgi:hypothetical protein
MASAFTIIFWVVALYLSSAYNTLLTPSKILVNEFISGTEVDFSSPEFWSWVHMSI